VREERAAPSSDRGRPPTDRARKSAGQERKPANPARRHASKPPSRSAAPTHRPPAAQTIRAAHRRLARRFGPLDPPRRWDPIKELVLTVLSQNTSDVNSGRAFAALRERFPTWEALANARANEVADAIRPGGLGNVKAPRVLAILREIEDRQGELDLGWMRRASDEDVERYLLSLPGVGPKTAAVVLAFSLGRPALPVDTHVHRVTSRLGWLPPKTTAAAAHSILAAAVSAPLRVPMHVGLIRLGREICRPGRPLCPTCPLNDLCPTAPTYMQGGRRPRSGKGATRAELGVRARGKRAAS
jgi:endonuclease-3